MRGCSSVVERNLAKVDVVGSNPITRLLVEPSKPLVLGDFLMKPVCLYNPGQICTSSNRIC
jgi:hypothetical protein